MGTPNLNLNITNTPSGSEVTFLTWRLLINGDGSTSNANIIDTWAGQVNGSIVNLTSACVTYGNNHNHSVGNGGSSINHSYLSGSGTNSHTTIDSFIASKASANGLASLDASGSVVQRPAISTATRTAGSIPISDADGFVDKWIEYKKSGTIINPSQVYTSSSRIVLMRADEAIYVTRVHLSTNTTGSTISGSIVYADDTQSFANATKVVTCDATGTFTAAYTTGSTVPSGKYLYYQMNSSPSVNITNVFLEVYYKYGA